MRYVEADVSGSRTSTGRLGSMNAVGPESKRINFNSLICFCVLCDAGPFSGHHGKMDYCAPCVTLVWQGAWKKLVL